MNILKSLLLAGVFTAFTTGAMAQEDIVQYNDAKVPLTNLPNKGWQFLSSDEQRLITDFLKGQVNKKMKIMNEDGKESKTTLDYPTDSKNATMDAFIKNLREAVSKGAKQKEEDWSNPSQGSGLFYKFVETIKYPNFKKVKDIGKVTVQEASDFSDNYDNIVTYVSEKYLAIFDALNSRLEFDLSAVQDNSKIGDELVKVMNKAVDDEITRRGSGGTSPVKSDDKKKETPTKTIDSSKKMFFRGGKKK